MPTNSGLHPLVSTYHLIDITQVSIHKSHFQTRLSLIDLGVKTINNWIDITNLFMYEYGQPLHCFDTDKLEGKLSVRMAYPGEKFVDLTGKSRSLTDQDLVVADDHKICALAGVIGSQETAVSDQTHHITIEIANFDPVTIRKTGVRYGLRTDAELRFEKKINPAWTDTCVDHLLQHIENYKADLGTYQILSHQHLSNIYPQHQNIVFDSRDLIQFIFGTQESASDFLGKAEKIVRGIGCDLQIDDHIWTCKAPAHRGLPDISIAEDLWEEVARIYGYDRIDGVHIAQQNGYHKLVPEVAIQKSVERYMIDVCHYDQVETYPWIHDDMLHKFQIDTQDLHQLINPTAPEKSYLRPSLLCGLYEIICKNFRHYDEIKICEIAKIWQGKKEYTALGCMYYRKSIKGRQEDCFLHLKGVITTLGGNYSVQDRSYRPSHQPFAHPHKQVAITAYGKDLGMVAQIHPLTIQKDKISIQSQVVYAQIILDHLKSSDQTPQFQNLENKAITKELCFTMPYDADASILSMHHIDGITAYSIYDIYPLDPQHKSVTFSYEISPDLVEEKVLEDMITYAQEHGFMLKTHPHS